MTGRAKIGSVLIIGAGIAGVQASLDLADSGFKVYLVDRSPSIGGVMPQLDKTFPTNDCAMCILAPKLVETGRHRNIELVLNADIAAVEGVPGNFKVTTIRRPRMVNEEKCTGCGICTHRCPVEVPDEFNRGLKVRKAIYLQFPQSVPPTHTIDQDACIGCGICERQCEAGAIEYSQTERYIDLEVGSIIIAPGFSEYDPSEKKQFGYGVFKNVLTSLELERMLSASGPFGGLVLRPSDGKVPKKIAFLQCVGSRDREVHERYCSAVCCMFSMKEAIIAMEHVPGLKPTIFFMDMRAYGKEFDDYYIRAEKEHGIRFFPMRIADIEENPNNENLLLTYREWSGEVKIEEFDMVVLAVGMRPPKDVEEFADKLGIKLNEYGFCQTDIFTPLDTTRPGIYVCGAFSVPKDIPDSVAQASGAAAKASAVIASERGALVTEKMLPPEKDVSGQEPRIGVFVCHCGINIGGVVDVPSVVEYAKGLDGVVYTEANLYTCSQDTQEKIKQKIKEHDLNRVIVASCTPRTHAPLFKDTCAEAQLNPYLFEMANIRDQCSWVHPKEPEKATEKAKDLVRMAVTKARLLEPLTKIKMPVKSSGLVIGGGISGMIAATSLADQGFDVHLLEKEEELGGIAAKVYFGFGGSDVQRYIKDLKMQVNGHPRITVLTNANIKSSEGYVGNFKTTFEQDGEDKEIEHGVVIIATGGKEYKPTEFMYGQDPRVMTQLEMEGKIVSGELDATKLDTVMMIQCVGSRIPERTYCSRICCTETIKNALAMMEQNPDLKIFILYRDMRTYGFREDYFREARDKGIIFLKFDLENLPVMEKDGKKLKITIFDAVLNRDIVINPDLVSLAVATLPADDTEKIAQIFKVPLTKDKFFLEAHAKLRPLDFSTDGIYLCGLAHSPKFIEECIFQASGAASRAATILSKDHLEGGASVSVVDTEKCRGCGRCVEVCEYGAITLVPSKDKDWDRMVSEINPALCKGCGKCNIVCCNKALSVYHFKRPQILAMIETFAKEEG